MESEVHTLGRERERERERKRVVDKYNTFDAGGRVEIEPVFLEYFPSFQTTM